MEKSCTPGRMSNIGASGSDRAQHPVVLGQALPRYATSSHRKRRARPSKKFSAECQTNTNTFDARMMRGVREC
jgi:hypothetical protein